METAPSYELISDRTFETQDIQLAASIFALGANLTAIDRSDPSRCTFIFQDSPSSNLERVIDAYWRRQLSIEPQALLSALKSIKSRLYGERL